MTAATGFAWLNELMVWIGRWFPRLLLIKAGNAAVKFGPRGDAVLLGAKLVVYWPITHEVTVVSTRTRTTEISGQLQDSEVISAVVVYHISDPVKALLTYHQVSSALDDFTQAALRAAYRVSLDASRHGASDDRIEDEMRTRLRAEFTVNGVEIEEAHIISRGRVIALKNIGDWAQHEDAKLA